MFSEKLHASVRALMGPSAVRVGPFLLGLDPHDDGVFRNYAVPDDGANPTADDVSALTAAFVDHGRTPRLEYLPELCPSLESRLVAAGFVTERRLPVMTCAPDVVVPHTPPPGIAVRQASTDSDLWQVAQSQNEAYGAGRATPHDLARLQRTRAGGGLVALAALEDDPPEGVGGGLVAPPTDGVAELAAIGVRAAHRGRGIARALTALLTSACPEAGIDTPFLTPAGPREERIYLSVGYRRTVKMLHISRRLPDRGDGGQR